MATLFKNKIEQSEYFMREALKQAQLAFEKNEVPIGAVITFENKIIAKTFNQVETLSDPTAHAEMIAITQAVSTIGHKWLTNCDIYVTIEPCSMCAGALVLARIRNLYYAAPDPKTGACGSIANIADNAKLNHRIILHKGILENECAFIISEFFKKKRVDQKATSQYKDLINPN